MRGKTFKSQLLVSGCLAIMLGSHSLATAQEATDEGETADDAASEAPVVVPETADEEKSYDTIYVTAQRRQERLEDVPLSIIAADASLLQKSGITEFTDLDQITPGVMIENLGAYTAPAVRGISTLTVGPSVENNVAVYIDGFYQVDTTSINSDLVNVESVQVLKGPQGTLYGRNATGGAIVINTLPPSETFTTSGSVTYARYDDVRIQGYVSGPITDKIGYSLAAYYRDSNGYIRDVGSDFSDPSDDFDAAPIRNENIRLKVQAEPVDWAEFTFGYVYNYVLDATALTYTIVDHGILPSSFYVGGMDQSSVNLRSDNGVKVNDWMLTSKFDTPLGELTSYTGYGVREGDTTYDFDGSKLYVVTGEIVDDHQHTFQQTLDLVVDTIEGVDLVVGASYFDNVYRSSEGRNRAGSTIIKVQNQRIASEAVAVYADATWEAMENLFFTLGARYTEEDKSLFYQEHAVVPGTPTAPTLDPPATATFDAFTPRAVVRYQLDDSSNIYASYTEGFRTGAFNFSPQPDPSLAVPVDSEKIKAYEIGYKTAGSNFRFDAAAFFYDFENLQVGVTLPSPVTPGTVVQAFINAPAAEVYGAEMNFAWTPPLVEALNLRGGLSLLDGEYTDFPNAVGTEYNALTGRNVTNYAQDWSGHDMIRSPEYSMFLGFDYTMDLLGGDLVLSGNANYTDDLVTGNASLYGDPAGIGDPRADVQRYRQDGYERVNLQIDWTDPTDHWTVGVFGDNITNSRFNITQSGSALGDYSRFSQPVTYGVKAGFKY